MSAAKLPSPDSLYLYNLQPQISESLELIYFDSSVSQVEVDSDEFRARSVSPVPSTEASTRNITPSPSTPSEIIKPTIPGDLDSCSVCVGNFKTQEERRNHYKTDFHRYNIKRSISNLPPVSEEEFDKLIEEESIESLSGSDSEEEDASQSELNNLDTIMENLSLHSNEDGDDQNTISHLNTKSPYIYFKSSALPLGKVFAIYKCIFTPEQLLNAPLQTVLKLSAPPVKTKKSALFMLGGGHFAGAIISHVAKNIRGSPANDKETRQEQAVNIIISKTFHRYTTRRKQGGSQSSSDNARGKANSAGSTIRRYNEQALIQEIRELLTTWKNHLADCEFIYVRAAGPSQRKILIGYEGSELKSNDTRIRTFPFTTKRATATELKRAWAELSYAKVVDMPKEDTKQKKKLQQIKDQLRASTVQKTREEKPEVSANEKHSSELVNILKKSKAPILINYLKKNKLDVGMLLEPATQYIHSPTLLHYAAAHGLTHMVQILLVNLKSDPTIKNESGKTAYELSANSATRKAFQVARHSLGEDYCDWKAAKVGPPKSKEDILEEEKEEQEQISKEKKRLIDIELAKKTDLELKTPKISGGGKLGGAGVGISAQADLNGLSDQQKMRLMREQRARAAEARFKKTD